MACGLLDLQVDAAQAEAAGGCAREARSFSPPTPDPLDSQTPI